LGKSATATTGIRCQIRTFLTPDRQPVLVLALLVKLTFRPPFPASPAPLLRNTLDHTVSFVIAEIFSRTLAVPAVPLAGVFTLASLTPVAQPVFVSASLAELTLVHLFLAFGALLHFCPLVTHY
jgi:hypothetical protein